MNPDPNLGREEVTIRFDDQKKQSDFSLFDGRLVIEMKYIYSGGAKAAVVKTLEGLARFYSQNANIGCLLFIIYVKEDTVKVDKHRWEADFSYLNKAPFVKTLVVEVP